MKKGKSAQANSQDMRKVLPTPIYLTPPHIDEEEELMMQEVLRSNWIAPSGPHLELFEDMLSLYHQGKRVLLLNSGTAAIHVALKLLNVKRDDYVLCSDFTFSATANPIVYEGAVPVFVDAEKDSWGMCPEQLENAILALDKKPVAVIIVHAYGMPARMTELKSVAEKYEIPVIEDAAECLGSHLDNAPCGTLGDFGVLSFNGNKIVTTGGGGALIFNDKSYYDRAYALVSQGHTSGDYNYSMLGYNYRMSNVAAGLGIAQFRKLEQKVQRKREVFEIYKEAFKESESIKVRLDDEKSCSNRWLTNISLQMRPDQVRKVIGGLSKAMIEARPVWKPLHSQSIYPKSLYKGGDVGLGLHEQGISLPSGTSLTKQDQQRVISTLLHLVES